jgi:hypothetical protein
MIRNYMIRAIATVAFAFSCITLAQAKDTLPTKARGSGEVISLTYIADPQSGNDFAIVEWEGSGIGSHAGRYTIRGTEYLHLELSEDGQVLLVAVGEYVTTVASGDTIFGTYRNEQVFGAPFPRAMTGDAVTLGGTGRFAGASGWESTVGFIYEDNTFSWEHEGWAAKKNK